jgi:magnesium chelatase accessory protein
MRARLDWAVEGPGWPFSAHSQFVTVGGLRIHVQHLNDAGATAPCLLLLHGTGASTHSFRGLMTVMGARAQIIACDLPGHGFTTGHRASDLTLPGMAQAIGALLRVLGAAPSAIIGHSAGCAVACRMALDGLTKAPLLIGLNAALLPFPGAAGRIFPSMARALFLNPFAPLVFASQANARSVSRLIAGTGSHLDAEGLGYYLRLMETSAHVSGAIGMMAQWDLARLVEDLPRLKPRLALIVGAGDKAVPAAQAQTVAGLAPKVTVAVLEGLGHLAHEEAPARAADAIWTAIQG